MTRKDMATKDVVSAILFGELQTSFDPRMSEWGNPAGIKPGDSILNPKGGKRTWRTETSK